MKRLLLMATLGVAIGPVALATSRSAPSRVPLSDAMMARLTGGSAADVTFRHPEGFITLVNDVANGTLRSATAFNLKGNRCLYTHSTGDSDVGFNVAGNNGAVELIVVPHGSAVPQLELYSDSATLIALSTATSQGSSPHNDYDGYSASLQTQCVGGSNNGLQCDANQACPGGACRTCDQAGNCNTDTVAGPCRGSCVGGSNNGNPCASSADCPSGTCTPFKGASAQACYLLTDCCKGSGCGNTCLTTGLDKNGGSGPIHAAVARVTTNGVTIGYAERLYQMVLGNSGTPTSTCSGNCDGPIDACGGTCPPPNCEN